MARRRSLLSVLGLLAVGSTPGCLETFSGGRLSNQIDQTQVTASKGEVVDLYDGALVERNDGMRARDRGIEAFNQEAYGEATDRFETAMDHFDAAVEGFSNAAALANEIGEAEAADICEAAEENTRLQVAATEAAMEAASTAAGGGSSGDVNGHVETYQDRLEAARTHDVSQTQALADVLQAE